MPLFVCDRCGCVDNTTLGGTYWIRHQNEEYFNDVKNGEALCTECTPVTYKDGSVNDDAGKWHNFFPKKQWDGKIEVLNRGERN